ncbi:MAG TPA: substrate-binding domain-containing protein [Alphaproteobacteria bacterium]|nr:substrate-binding domain-containing protein [Alphaproteobacteria bacterium]
MKLASTLAGGMAAAVALAAASTPAHAAVTGLYGGGGTLAEKVYRDLFNRYGSTSGGDLCAGLATVCPTTHYNSDVEILYVGVGSGNGLKALDNYDPTLYVSGGKKPDAVPTPSGSDLGTFYGTGSGATWVPGTGVGPYFPKVTFSGSDDSLSATDVAAVAAHGFGPVVQLPGIVTAIAVPFQPSSGWNPKGAQPIGGSSKVQLSLNTLCGIFNGDITTWNNAEIKKDNKNTVLGTGPITVVYRHDGSGTTFLFTNALLNQCGTGAHPNPKSTHPIPDQWVTDNGASVTVNGSAPFYKSGTSFFINVFNAGHLPSTFINNSTLTGVSGGANGSGGVKAAILNTPGSIGYVSPDFVLPVDNTGPQAANLQTYISFKNGTTPIYKAPTPATATPIMAGTTPPSFVGSPSPASNPLNWGALNPLPIAPGAYPIGGFSFINFYSCYSSVDVVNALVSPTAGNVGYLKWYYGNNSTNGGIPAQILANDGFAPVPASWAAAINKLVSDPNLGIGSPKVGKKAGTRACKAITNGA